MNERKESPPKYYDFLTALFVTVLLVSNIASSAKIVDSGLTLLKIRLVFDAGTLLFPLSYIFGDILTEVYGYGRGRRVIWIGFFCSGLTSLVLWIVGMMPAETGWAELVGQEKFDLVLGGMKSGAIVAASLLAYLFGEFSNSVVLSRMKIMTKGRFLWTRTISSTLVGQAIDTAAFISLATLFRVPGFSPQIWLSLIITNYIFKCGVEAAMTPVTYLVVNKLKKAENCDHYDYNLNYNPFRLSAAE